MACEKQKYARDVVECRDFFFFTRRDVICDRLQCRSTKKLNLFVLYYNKVSKNHDAKTPQNKLAKSDHAIS